MMLDRLKLAIAKAIFDLVASFGKSVTLTGSLSIMGNFLGIELAKEIGVLNSIMLLVIGLCAMILIGFFSEKEK